MITKENLKHVFIRINTKPGFEKNGVYAVTTLCFDTSPETQISFWYAKLKGKFKYTTPSVPMDQTDGTPLETKCLSGGLASELIELAAEAQAKLKKDLGKPSFGKLYRIGEKAEQLN